MIRIKEFAARFGLSVRTIHYYQHIGLLVPALVDEKEQRWYGRKKKVSWSRSSGTRRWISH